MLTTLPVSALLILCVGSLPAWACAEDEPKDRDQHLQFDDDLLNADLGTPRTRHQWRRKHRPERGLADPLFSGHLPKARTWLIRPRTNFIPELYQSAAND
jgi:hypothetical protein